MRESENSLPRNESIEEKQPLVLGALEVRRRLDPVSSKKVVVETRLTCGGKTVEEMTEDELNALGLK